MDFPGLVEGCTCGLKLGAEQLSTHDILTAQELERKQELTNQTIHFLGACNSSQRCTIKSKIDELKENISEFYFDKDGKVIAIPNQVNMSEKEHLRKLDPDETDDKIKKKNAIFMDKFYEDILHQTIISTMKNMNFYAFVFKGFQSEDCIKAKLEKAKIFRKENQCKCKIKEKCKCEKPKYTELNAHEKDVMELLNIKHIDEKELSKCKELIKDWKDNDDSKGTEEIDSWLFNKV